MGLSASSTAASKQSTAPAAAPAEPSYLQLPVQSLVSRTPYDWWQSSPLQSITQKVLVSVHWMCPLPSTVARGLRKPDGNSVTLLRFGSPVSPHLVTAALSAASPEASRDKDCGWDRMGCWILQGTAVAGPTLALTPSLVQRVELVQLAKAPGVPPASASSDPTAADGGIPQQPAEPLEPEAVTLDFETEPPPAEPPTSESSVDKLPNHQRAIVLRLYLTPWLPRALPLFPPQSALGRLGSHTAIVRCIADFCCSGCLEIAGFLQIARPTGGHIAASLEGACAGAAMRGESLDGVLVECNNGREWLFHPYPSPFGSARLPQQPPAPR
eukprot:NODE_2464_length_1195_cov_55.361257_g2249_i0.p1 GENE.NODE_2464_length_1195_cov_55.361257_g2249_i0~~NODE_2464_length_1195_cov_55.361257_g2249_i0.p1  ORF type:complete len:327 (+),score=53.82 NODE_2464_length_1195_cov_55.361257_g2249_i0:114-1094(+)